MDPALRTSAWLGGLALALAGLLAAGGPLAPPPAPTDPAAMWAWVQRTDPTLAAFSILRLAALVVVAYLLASTLLVLAAQASRRPALLRASDRLTLPSTRRLVQHLAGAGLALTLVGSAAPLVAGAGTRPAAAAEGPTGTVAPPPAPAPVLHDLGDDPVLVHLGPTPGAGATPVDPAAADPPPPTTAAQAPPVDHRGADPTYPAGDPPAATVPAPTPTSEAPGDDRVEPEVPPAPTAAPVPEPPPASVLATPPDDELDRRHHTIVAGDHLWGVAERTLATAWGSAPTPAETLGYLQVLVDTNRAVFAVPDDPDLVFPGQVFSLPEVATR